MAYEQMLVPVLEKQALAKNIYRMVLQCRSIAQQAACGQFVHLSLIHISEPTRPY